MEVSGDIVGRGATIESVNQHLIEKLDEMITDIDTKVEPELLKVITESVAKLNTSLRGNDIFAPKETESERYDKLRNAAIRDILG